ncbi:PTS glucitol/sorbitol transporter subunit IIA [Aggregatilineales bacterium SYSU G02658]
MMKYQAKVTFVGPMASEFLKENIAVLFSQDAPEELREFAILHDGKRLAEPIEVGDLFEIDGEAFKVRAVGPVANDNLANLGHLALKFNGETEVEMPGDVCLDDHPVPKIKVGTMICIRRGE